MRSRALAIRSASPIHCVNIAAIIGHMEVTLAGGVVVDVATRDDLAAHHRMLAELAGKREEGDYVPLFGSSTAPAGIGSGPLVIPLSPRSPAAGRVWALQYLAIFTGDGAGAIIANLNATVLIGRSPIGPGGAHPAPAAITIDPQEVVLPGLSVPTAGGIIVPGKLLVRASEQVYAVLRGSGLVVGTVYQLAASVLEAEATREANIYL